jgi:hypothetical protein
VEHQAFVGTEYFDQVGEVISGGTSSTLAMEGSTEREQITKTATTHRPKPSRARVSRILVRGRARKVLPKSRHRSS